MKRLDLSLADPAADLALDEALLESAERGDGGEVLRLWAFDRPAVIIGRGSRLDGEANTAYCRDRAIPILRRCSGGAAIVGGPGCLMYSVVLNLERRPELRQIDRVHQVVMSRLLQAVQQQQPDAQWQGTCDLTVQGRKFSGNSLRIARHHLLYHGTILHSADLEQIHHCLATPPRQPEYRCDRSHVDFITNVAVAPTRLSDDLATAFEANTPLLQWPQAVTQRLKRERYDDPAWHHRH
jgi:lipoate---protein ligase